MELQLVRHTWGIDIPPEQALPRIKAFGYAAIEAPLTVDTRWTERRKEHGLGFIAMAFTSGRTVAEHVSSFREQLDVAGGVGASQLTSHSGSDAWTLKECETFFADIVKIEADSSIAVGHETHRGRAMFTPWLTRDLLQRFPSLRLCCDFSHWVCIAERVEWDDDAGSILALCARRAVHVHCRVGHEEGPQVSDPAAPEFRRHLDAHLNWWSALWRGMADRGVKVCTATPEFGPPPYMPTLPHTNVPVANLWNVCDWMAARVKERFSREWGAEV